MSKANGSHGVLTRRSFLKTTAALAGAASLAGLAGCASGGGDQPASTSEEQVFCGACRGASCNSGCSLNIHVRDGKVVYVTPRNPSEDPNDHRFERRACLKGMSHVNRLYNPDRAMYPLRRVGERGSGEWERITWDEAITEITDKWKEIRAEYGNDALAWTGSQGNAGFCANGSAAFLLHAMGMVNIYPGYDNAINGWSPKMLGYGALYTSNFACDFANARCMILWGANLSNSYMQQWRFVADAQEKGGKLIVIDTCYTPAAARADKVIFVRPGTDAALAIGMMAVCLEDDLIDMPFIKRGTCAPLLVKREDRGYYRLSDAIADAASGKEILIGGKTPTEVQKSLGEPPEDPVMAARMATTFNPFVVFDNATGGFALLNEASDPQVEGVVEIGTHVCDCAYQLLLDRIAEYPLDTCAEICDVPVDEIRELAHTYAENSPATILQGFGIDHYANGHYNCAAITALALITGNVGRHGASAGVMFPLGPYANSNAPKLDGEWAYEVPALELPKFIESGEYLGKPFTIKGIYCQCTNWIENNAGMEETINYVLPNLDIHVCADSVMSGTARFADYVLPAAHFFEQEDVIGRYIWNPYVLYQEKAIEPMFECKSDFDIQRELLKAMGVGPSYWDMTPEDYLRVWFDSDLARQLGITYENIKEKKAILYTDPEYVHGDYETGVFPTETGRAQFYIENPTVQMDWGQEWDKDKEYLPILFEPPIEAWTETIAGYERNPLADKYPLTLFQEHTKWRSHSAFGYNQWLRELDPEPVVFINPKDAEPRGIETGDVVRVFNDNGSVVLKARINPGVRAGSVNIPKGWQTGQFIEGHYQRLTHRKHNPVCENSVFYDILLEVEKVED